MAKKEKVQANVPEHEVPEFEKTGELTAKSVKSYGLNDLELQRILEFRRIASIQREIEGMFLENIVITRFAAKPQAVRMFYVDFTTKLVTVREYDEKQYLAYTEKVQAEQVEANAKAQADADAARVAGVVAEEKANEVVTGDGQPA